MLAKYGYVEPAERRGKERPWRTVGRGRQTRFDPDVPESLPAASAVADLVLGQEAARVRAWLAGAAAEDPRWLLASTLSSSSFYATREELDALAREVEALTDRFAGRWDDPSLRPEGLGRRGCSPSSTPTRPRTTGDHPARAGGRGTDCGHRTDRTDRTGRAAERGHDAGSGHAGRAPRATLPPALGRVGFTNFADSVLAIILAVWVKDLTGSNGAAGLVFAALGLPALASPFLGQLADRVSRRRMLVATYLVGAVVLLALLLVRGPGQVWLVLLVTVVYSGSGSRRPRRSPGSCATCCPTTRSPPRTAASRRSTRCSGCSCPSWARVRTPSRACGRSS